MADQTEFDIQLFEDKPYIFFKSLEKKWIKLASQSYRYVLSFVITILDTIQRPCLHHGFITMYIPRYFYSPNLWL